MKSIESFAIIRATSTSVNLSITGFGLVKVPISTSIAYGLSICNKLLHAIFMKKQNKYKKQYEKDHLTINFFDKLYRKTLQDNWIDKSEYESLSTIFTRDVDVNKNESFL